MGNSTQSARAEHDGASSTPNCAPTIVHISAPSGSGKTTLGKAITAAGWPGVRVAETDMFIQPDTDIGSQLIAMDRRVGDNWTTTLLKERKELWERGWHKGILATQLETRLHGTRVIVFVGLTNNFALPGDWYTGELGTSEVRRLYLNVSQTERNRRLKLRQEEDAKKGIRYEIDTERDERHARAADKWHRDHKYTWMEGKDIMAEVHRLSVERE